MTFFLSIDPKTIPVEDYKAVLKEKAALEAQFEEEKRKRNSVQSQLSQIRKKYAVPSEAKAEEAPDSPSDSMLSQMQDEIKQLKAQLSAKVSTNQPDYTPSVTHISTTPGISVQSTTASSSAPVVTTAKLHPEHTFKPFQAGCTTCGTKNEKFVPEMKCKNCKGTVGSFEVVKDMDFCPYCTQPLIAQPITDEAKRKVQEFLAKPAKVEVAA